ncbi:MAG: nucleotidyltransferase family protein [Planctomycetota bacterium]
MTELELLRLLRLNYPLWQALRAARSLGLKNWYIGAGAICQTVWNIRHYKPAPADIKDVDLIYFDPDDLSAAGEAMIREAAMAQFSHLELPVEVVNQARVHLWYEEEFGFEIKPYQSSEQAIGTWPTTASSIGIHWSADDEIVIHAPFGLSDIDQMIVRPNKKLINQKIYESKAERWKKQWPELTVVDWDADQRING